MSIVLPPDLEAIVTRRVAEGRGESTEAVLREALVALESWDWEPMPRDHPETEEEVEATLARIEEGFAQVDRGEFVTREEFLERMRRLTAR